MPANFTRAQVRAADPAYKGVLIVPTPPTPPAPPPPSEKSRRLVEQAIATCCCACHADFSLVLAHLAALERLVHLLQRVRGWSSADTEEYIRLRKECFPDE